MKFLSKHLFFFFTAIIFIGASIFFSFKGLYLLLIIFPLCLLVLYASLYHTRYLFLSLAFLTPLSVNIEEYTENFGLFLPTEPILFGLMILYFFYQINSSISNTKIWKHPIIIAAIIYFFKDELFGIQKNKRILNLIILGSIPLIIIGYILYSTNLIYNLRNLEVIAWTTLIFAVVLYISDKSRFDKKISSNLNFQSILFIGIFQILSLIPGVSRAGITITAARILKFNRVDSSKISFLLSIPALAGASALSLKDVFEQSIEFNYLAAIAVISSFIFSFLTVKFFLIYINKFSMNAFVIYRIVIALILFSLIY